MVLNKPTSYETGTALQEEDPYNNISLRPTTAHQMQEKGRKSTTATNPPKRLSSLPTNIKSPEVRKWTPEDIEYLANMALRCWAAGHAADIKRIAKNMKRSAADIQAMLKLLLTEYTLYSQKAHWADQDEGFIRHWAALEYPECSILGIMSVGYKRPLQKSSLTKSAVNKCLSLLTCRCCPASSIQSIPQIIEHTTHFNIPPSPSPHTSTEAIAVELADSKEEAKENSNVNSGDSLILYDANNSAVYSIRSTLNGNTNLLEKPSEDSDQEIGVNSFDGDIDLQHIGISASTRKEIRTFVHQYIKTYPSDFLYRVAYPGLTESRFCYPLRVFLGPEETFANPELKTVVERELQGYNNILVDQLQHSLSINMRRSSLNFHFRLQHKLQEFNIFVGDSTWYTADRYGTEYFNRIIEDVNYLAYEEYHGQTHQTATEAEDISLQPLEHLRAEEVGSRMNNYKRASYMGMVAEELTKFYVHRNMQVTARATKYGYKPVPTAIDYEEQFDEDVLEEQIQLPCTDVAIRNNLHTHIINMLPHATDKSTMIAMQRAIEVYSRTVIGIAESKQKRLGKISNKDVDSCSAISLTRQSRIEKRIKKRHNNFLTVDTASGIAQCLAESWFANIKNLVLEALMVNHEFRPRSLAEVCRWRIEGAAPPGCQAELIINVTLYNYLAKQELRVNKTQWLYASGTAMLRLIQLSCQYYQSSGLLEHVDLQQYTALFQRIIAEEARTPRQKIRTSEDTNSGSETTGPPTLNGNSGKQQPPVAISSKYTDANTPDGLSTSLAKRKATQTVASTGSSKGKQSVVMEPLAASASDSRTEYQLALLRSEIQAMRNNFGVLATISESMDQIVAILKRHYNIST